MARPLAPISTHLLYECLIRFECDASNAATARADIRDVRQTMYHAFEECDWRARRDDAEDSRESRAKLEQAKASLQETAAAALRVARAYKVPGVPIGDGAIVPPGKGGSLCGPHEQCPYHASGGPETIRCGGDTYKGACNGQA